VCMLSRVASSTDGTEPIKRVAPRVDGYMLLIARGVGVSEVTAFKAGDVSYSHALV